MASLTKDLQREPKKGCSALVWLDRRKVSDSYERTIVGVRPYYPNSRDVEAEAVEAVNFLWKRKGKHFDERGWKRKRTQKHKTSRGAGSGSVKNLTASTSLPNSDY